MTLKKSKFKFLSCSHCLKLHNFCSRLIYICTKCIFSIRHILYYKLILNKQL